MPISLHCPCVPRKCLGIRHSWMLRPPCEYSSDLLKHADPGGVANDWAEFQYHGTRIASGVDSPAITAARDQRVFVRCFGRSTFGRPPGNKSQPWSVTIRTFCQPLSRRAVTRSAKRSSSSGIWRATSDPRWCPNLSISPVSPHPRACSLLGPIDPVTGQNLVATRLDLIP